MVLFKKMVWRLVTALILAYAAFRVVAVYAIFTFWGAPVISAIFLFLAYLFLSQKYSGSLQAIFLFLALYVGYQAVGLQHRPTPESQDFIRARRLFLAAARYQMDEKDLTNAAVVDLNFCRLPACPEFLKNEPSAFWFWEKSNMTDDKPGDVWYINENLDLFVKSSAGLAQLPLPHSNKGKP